MNLEEHPVFYEEKEEVENKQQVDIHRWEKMRSSFLGYLSIWREILTLEGISFHVCTETL